ncbi:Nuclear transcription factor Y subunit B-8 [Orobanche hederae]
MADSPGGYGVAGGSGSGSHENCGDGGGDQSPKSSVREQDRFLPIANIGRIMKKALPPNGKIAKDAKDTVQECVSEFISFVTSEASDKCQKEKRKTINGDDLLWAMATLGFEEYISPLKAYLARYREASRFNVTLHFFMCLRCICGTTSTLQLEGDTKGSIRGADGSAKKEASGSQLHTDAHFAHQGSYSQGFGYSNPQIDY